MKGKYKVVDEHSYNNIQSAITLRDTIVRRLDTWLQQNQDIASTIEALLPFQNVRCSFLRCKMFRFCSKSNFFVFDQIY